MFYTRHLMVHLTGNETQLGFIHDEISYADQLYKEMWEILKS